MLAGDFFSKKMVFRIGVLPKMCVMKIQLIALSLCVSKYKSGKRTGT